MSMLTQGAAVFLFSVNLVTAASVRAGSPAGESLLPALDVAPVVASSRTDFAVSPRLRKNVDFWIDIYSKYATHQGVIHDTKYIDKVFEILDFKNSGQEQRIQVRASKIRWKAVLLSIHKKRSNPESFTPDEKRIFDLYADVDEPDKFLNAAHRKRLRFQLGQKNRFEEGLKYSGRYLPHMEKIFKEHKLPLELTRLPFVESSFNLKALSKVGASGIWQFMPSTARLFITVNDVVDERNDPIRATEAAAKLLKMNYDSLGAWPLAVTAYNHGRKGMMRAVRIVGSDKLEDIMDNYRARRFGFASSNFYACLLAAIEVERDAEKYFGKIERDLPWTPVDALIPDDIHFSELVRFLKLDKAAIQALNPGLSSAVFSGRKRIPAGYRLRLPIDPTLGPEAAVRVFLAGYDKIPPLFKGGRQKRRAYDREISSENQKRAN